MAKKKRTVQSGTGRRRSPGWKVVSYDELENWREAQGLSKKKAASLIGVTNSTYHNWARGIAVATPSTQRKIRELMSGTQDTPGAKPKAADPSPVHSPTPQLEVLTTTASVVKTYLQTHQGKLTPEQLIQLVGEVRDALGG